MEAVLDVYQRPYTPSHPVINLVDESSRQLIGEVRKSFTDKKGVVHQDYEYQRNGVAELYMLTEAKAGWREVLIKENHKSQTYAEIIQYLAEEKYPNAQKITLIEDNLSAHKLETLYEILPPERARKIIERIEVIRTPKHGSWLNIAEIELSNSFAITVCFSFIFFHDTSAKKKLNSAAINHFFASPGKKILPSTADQRSSSAKLNRTFILALLLTGAY